MNSRIPNIARVLIGIAIVALIGWWMFGVYRAQYEGTRNISRADYNAALQRWHDKGVSTYEEVVNIETTYCSYCGEYTLRVDTAPDKITVLAYTPKPHEWSELTAGTLTQDQILHRFTVEGLFTQVDDALKAPLRCDNPPAPISFDYDIAFSGALGYPEHLNTTSRPGPSRECGGLPYFVSVKSVKIIK